MLDFLADKTILAMIIIILLLWIIMVIYRKGRGEAIEKADFWRSKWKIVLFWIIIAALILGYYYFKDRMGW